MSIQISGKVTLWVNRAIAVFLALMVVFLPQVLLFYAKLDHLTNRQVTAVQTTYYCCVPAIALALWKLDVLLRSILRGEVFTHRNVGAIRAIRWSCFAVCLLCLAPSFVYMPLWLIVAIMGFLTLVVTVLVNVMKAAVAIREENDLTI